MRKRRLSISYTFVTLIEGRWRNLLSLRDFWAFEVSFESSSARFLRLCTVFVRLRTLVMRSGNVDKFGVSAFFMHKNEITLFTVSFCFKPEASRGERAMQELGLQA